MQGYRCKRCGARSIRKYQLVRHFWDDHRDFVLRRMFYAGVLGSLLGATLLIALGELWVA